jgi:hypothetical protein
MELFIIVSVIMGLGIPVFLWFRHPAPTTGYSSNEEQEIFIETYVFPTFIEYKVQAKYPHLNESQIAQVLTGLRDFFHACQRPSRAMVGMPSQVVDVAWHEFILDTREYQYFCERAFDRFLHHTPAEAMPIDADAQRGLKRTWHLSCIREGIDPQAPLRLPLLFSLDSALNIPDGFFYSLDPPQQGDDAPYCAKQIGCTWVPTRQDPPKPLKSSRFGSGGCGGGCGSSCGGD